MAWKSPLRRSLLAAFIGFALAMPARADVLELNNGDKLQGRVRVWNEDKLVWDTGAGILEVHRSAIRTVRVGEERNDALPEPLWPRKLTIQGRGFFRVELPDGTFAYTRDGRFQIDEQGRVLSPDGYLLDPPIQINQPDATAVEINRDGRVEVIAAASPDAPICVGQLQLFHFINPDGLRRFEAGQAYFRESGKSGPPMGDIPCVGSAAGFIEVGPVPVKARAQGPRRGSEIKASYSPDGADGRSRVSVELPQQGWSVQADVPELDIEDLRSRQDEVERIVEWIRKAQRAYEKLRGL